jgi:ribosomal protein S18 acetylase RimI-like enzyme
VRETFQAVRRRMLPEIVAREYAAAKAAFDQKEYEPAIDQFRRVMAFLEDPATHCWVAEAGDLAVGFLLAYTLRRRHGDPLQLFLYEIGTRRGWRRRGVATALVTHLTAWAEQAEIRRGFVLTGRENRAAIAFYESLGWRAEGDGDLVFAFEV